MLTTLRRELHAYANPEKAEFLKRFFKTGKGQYAEGDIFLGINVPISRKIALHYKELPLDDVAVLLKSKIHEERLIALLILIEKYKKALADEKKMLFAFYLNHTKYINNWDLVDTSADKIVGEYLVDKDSTVLIKLANSENLWEKRIAILSTFAFIRRGDPEKTFAIADILLHDTHDLIHKAVGWLLREVGKSISQETEEAFLKTRYKTMPRTMLRYSIEHFTPEKRKNYLTGTL